MNVNGRPMRTIWLAADGARSRSSTSACCRTNWSIARLATLDDAARAIRDMPVRGAPLIGATAAYGVALAMRADPSDAALDRAVEMLAATRPTAVNLRWALDEMRRALPPLPPARRRAAALRPRRRDRRGGCRDQPRDRRARPRR